MVSKRDDLRRQARVGIVRGVCRFPNICRAPVAARDRMRMRGHLSDRGAAAAAAPISDMALVVGGSLVRRNDAMLLGPGDNLAQTIAYAIPKLVERNS
jgi:hypothetical protein